MNVRVNRVSRGRVNRLEREDDFGPDARSDELRAIAVVQDPELITALEAVFEGTDVMRDQDKANMLVQARHEIHAEWIKVRQSFLAIGRALLSLQDRLTADEFRRLEQGADRVFPFSRTVLVQLRQVAAAVVSGRINEKEMPGSYSVAYQLAAMDGPTMEIARARNIVRPNVTRTEIIAFRREVSLEPGSNAKRIDLAGIRSEKARLGRMRSELADRLAKIDARLAQLSAFET